MAQRPNTTDDFWRHVERSDTCWNWRGAINLSQSGVAYGRFQWRGQSVLAHRFSWELHNDQLIPAGKMVCHHCDNPLCVRPNHLYVGTAKTNAEDRERRQRRDTRPGEHHYNARLTEADALAIRQRYAAGNDTFDSIARDYPVSSRTVGKIIRGELWRTADGPIGARRPTGRPRSLIAATEEVIRQRATELTQREVAIEFGISQAHVSRIVNHKH